MQEASDRSEPFAAESIHAQVRAHETRDALRTSLIGVVALACVIAYVHATFASIVATPLLTGWTAAMALWFAVWCGAVLVFLRRAPDAGEIARFWVPFGSSLMMACNIAIAASVWILLPPADPMLRHFMVSLYVWFVIVELFTTGEADRVGIGAIVLVLGSLIAFLLTHPMPYAVELAIFLALFGVTLLLVGRFIRAAVAQATEARLIAERTGRELEIALAAVAAERDARTRFLASASHDLQQPVQAASLFFDQALSVTDLRVRERAVSGARSAFASVQSLLESMLDHLRLDAGAVAARLAPVAIDEILAAVALEQEAVAQAAGMRIALAPSRLVTSADARLLRRALDNLVANAIRHAGGSRVLIGARLRAGAVELWVIDDGRGIPAQDLPRLFEEFTQGSDHGLDNRGGFGLGLSSARRMIELQEGALLLDRRWTGGSAFRIRLGAGRRMAAHKGVRKSGGGACEAA